MGLVDELNRWGASLDSDVFKRSTSPFQRAIHSVHFYPFMVVIEKHSVGPTRLEAPAHGSE